ncbi:Gfo/Idh/MocA family oxidoreductase [Chloroflexota bacterium]
MEAGLDEDEVERGSMSDRNIAVIGCGYWGENLIRNFNDLGALHTICDTDPKVLGQIANHYPKVNAIGEYHRILQNDEIKGVVIATPAILHYSMTKEAILSGKDVFIEKPLALKVKDGKELVSLAEKESRTLMVGHLLEYHPAISKLKELVDKGELGRIQYIYSNRLNLGKFRVEENILWSFAPHDISAILLLLGNEMPSKVSVHGGFYLNHNIADTTVTTMAFGNGVRAHIFVSWLHPFKEQRLVVIGDKKMAAFNDSSHKDKLLFYDHEIEWIGIKPVPHQKRPYTVEVSSEEPLRIECQDFIDCMGSIRKPRADGRKGLQVLEILSSCQESLEWNGKVVTLGGGEESFFAHETSIIEKPCNIGKDTKIWHFSHLMPEAKIGEGCVIGQNVFIGRGVRIGNDVKIENNISVYEGVTLEDYVFCGPSCVFTNVINPRSHIPRKHEFKPTLVKEGATIGANVTVICGNTIGRHAFIGAGAVVTSDIPDYALAYGSPAQVHGWICKCGVKLQKDSDALSCTACGKTYQIQGQNCIPLTEGKSGNNSS